MMVNWKKYFNSTNPIIDRFLQKYGFEFLKQTFEKLKKAELESKPYIIIIQFRNSKIKSLIKKNDYNLAIRMLLDLCVRLEYYELCSEINSYINKPQTRKRRKVINVTKKIVMV